MGPTIRDVARRAGVSLTTASRVLSGSTHPVTLKMRERVLRAAQELDFTPNAFARGLSKREFHIIGLVIPDIQDPYFTEIARGTEDVANRHGYMVLLCNTDRKPAKERKYVEELRAMRAGIVLTGGAIDREEHLEDLTKHPAPVVVIGRHSLPFSSVQIDNIQGAIDATSHLIELGYRRIALISGPFNSATASDRLEGFRRAMGQAHIPVDEDLIAESDFTIEGGAQAFRQLLKASRPPDAIFGANDDVAIGAIGEAKRCGLRVPQDLAVVGFNGVAIAEHLDPPLSTIQLPLQRIGEIAAELLLKELQEGETERIHMYVKGQLVVRGSTVASAGNIQRGKA